MNGMIVTVQRNVTTDPRAPKVPSFLFQKPASKSAPTATPMRPGSRWKLSWQRLDTSKAAIRSFARTWSNELRERRIRVNKLSPGHIDTPIFDTWQQGDALVKLKEELADNVPLGRLGDSDEIAKAVSFLASDEASYVNSVELFVDGGVAQI